MAYIGIGIVGILIIIVIIITINTINFKTEKLEVESGKDIKVDVEKASRNLSEVIKLKTISNSDYSKTDWNEYKKLHKYLEAAYPNIHSKLEKEVVNEYSLLYKWKGKDNSKKPILLTGHMDVVPVEEGTEKDWKQEPFSGAIKEGYVWGRGTLDVKINVTAIMDAVEELLEKEYIPDRDIYIAFGHDEEVGGYEGALEIVEFLKGKEVELGYVLDEGGCVTEGAIKGIDAPIAVIGIAEKGYADIRLTAVMGGGHASMPPKSTSLGMISNAVLKLERNQLKTKISQPVKDMLNFIGPEMKLANRIIISNLWIFSPLFKKIFSSTHSGNALLRTTTAATMAQASSAPNVLPQKTSATFNFRIIPGETGEDLLNHIEKTIDNPNINVEVLRLDEPSNISSVKADEFKVIQNTVYQVFPEAVISPYLVLGGTDARKYQCICENIYRFCPYKLKNEDLSKMHGTNECISLENIESCVKFYTQLILNS